MLTQIKPEHLLYNFFAKNKSLKLEAFTCIAYFWF